MTKKLDFEYLLELDSYVYSEEIPVEISTYLLRDKRFKLHVRLIEGKLDPDASLYITSYIRKYFQDKMTVVTTYDHVKSLVLEFHKKFKGFLEMNVEELSDVYIRHNGNVRKAQLLKRIDIDTAYIFIPELDKHQNFIGELVPVNPDRDIKYQKILKWKERIREFEKGIKKFKDKIEEYSNYIMSVS